MAMADTTPARQTRMVNYLGVLQQALRDVAAWVEHGIAPPASTAFELVDGQVLVPPTRQGAAGHPAVVELTANGGERPTSPSATRCTFVASSRCRPARGTIVAAEWDFDGAGDYPLVDRRRRFGQTASAHGDPHLRRAGHLLPRASGSPPTARATPTRAHARIQNLGRVRVVVG